MSYAEAPALTDAEQIKLQNEEILQKLSDITERLDKHAEGINGIGQNTQWIVDNVQNVFAVLGNPAMMSQMMGQVMGGMSNGSGPAADAAE